jgi:hypothetical protein
MPHERLTAAAAVTVVAGDGQWELVSVLLAHGRLKHKTLIEEVFVLEARSVRRPTGAAKYAVNSSRRRWWWPRNAQTTAWNTLVSKSERIRASDGQAAKKTQKTAHVLRLPARLPKRALTFSRYISCWWVGLRATLTGLKTYSVALGVTTYT